MSEEGGTTEQRVTDGGIASRPCTGTRWPVVFWRAGTVSLVAAVVVAAVTTGFDDAPLVIGRFVVQRWQMVSALLLTGVVLWFLTMVVRDYNTCSRGSRARRVGVVATTAATSLASAGAFLFAVLLGPNLHITFLTPIGPGGCQVVVGEDGFLLIGRVEVYVRPAGSWRLTPVDTVLTDDGYAPITAGTFRLTWTDDGARLATWDTSEGTITMARESEPLTCAS